MDNRTIDFLGRAHNNYYVVPLKVCRIMIYDNLLKLKDELKGKPEEKPKLKRVMSILMRRYGYGTESVEDFVARENEEHSKAHAEDIMEEYRWGDFRDEIAAVRK